MSLTFTPSQMYLRDLDRQLAAGRVYLAQLDSLIAEQPATDEMLAVKIEEPETCLVCGADRQSYKSLLCPRCRREKQRAQIREWRARHPNYHRERRGRRKKAIRVEYELDEPMHDFCRRCGVQIEVGKQGGQPELCADCAPIVYRERARERAEKYRERNRHGKR